MLRLRRWIGLGRAVGARRLLVDGSFVTAKAEPADVEAVMLVPGNFLDLVAQGVEAAVELEEMFLTRQDRRAVSRGGRSGLAGMVRIL